MRCAAWLVAVGLCACDRRTVSKVPDTPIAIAEEQYEATLPLNPVRDSADAVARAMAEISPEARRRVTRITSVTSDSVGYIVVFDLDGPDPVAKGNRILVKRNGAVYFLADIR